MAGIAKQPGCVFAYLYDFGDSWKHVIHVEWITETEEQYPGHPVCLEGEFACPPEDCGGIHGYYNDFLPAYFDPEHKEHLSARAWAGEIFDPEVFDRDQANGRLGELG